MIIRSQEKELLDLGQEHYSPHEYAQCLRKLFLINRLLGIFDNTARHLKCFAKASSLLDVGCGSGLFLLHLSKIFKQMKLVGIDISTTAIYEAQKNLVVWQKQKMATQVSFDIQPQPQLNISHNQFDIILMTLVCHHIDNDDLVNFLREAYLAADKAVIINDLHRSRLAYWLYALISPVLFRNRLITHDGLISIKRGFTRPEWEKLLQQANIVKYQIKWRFPFCWQLILWK